MSIIQEALKKAQRKSVTVEIVKKEPVHQDTREEPPSYIRKPVNKIKSRPAVGMSNSRIALYGIILACVVAVLFIKYYPSRPVKNVGAQTVLPTDDLESPAEAAAVLHAPVISRTQNIETVRDVKHSIRQGDFILSGIMDLEDGRRAIINNLVVVEGDSIGNVKVGDITTNSVTLKKGENSLTLQLK